MAELGIVGRVRGEHKDVVAADFEYALLDRLTLGEQDTCVIHPMFYSMLNVTVDKKVKVYPFPDHPDFQDVFEST